MTVVPSPDQIRDVVVQVFLRYGASANSLLTLEERMLVDEGQYVARSYRTAHLMAMWLVEIGLVQFYDAEGRMLRTIDLHEAQEAQWMAA